MNIEKIAIEKLMLDPSNARKHDSKNLEAIKGSLLKFGQQKPIVVNDKNIVIAGNGTLEAARALGWLEIDIVRTALTGNDAVAYALADNRTTDLSVWDDEALGKTLHALFEQDYDIGSIGFDAGEYGLGQTEGQAGQGHGSLAERFGAPPFSVLDTRQGYWQDRKRAWLSIGIESELGRGGGLALETAQIGKMAMHNDPMQRKAKYEHGV